MQIKNLKLTNYRNHIDLKLNLDDNFISIIGPNGIGKTNILESIHLISTGKSPRTKYDSDVINYDKSFAIVNAKIKSVDDEFDLEFQIINEGTDHRSRKRVKVNKVPRTMAHFCGIFNSVLFMPEDIQLIKGPPSERRRYMDSLLTQVDPTYKKTLSTYTKAVKQRNKILEKINKERRGWDEINYWTVQLLKTGSILQTKRAEMFEMLQPQLNFNSEKINGGNKLTEIKYKKNEMDEEKFNKYQEREIAAKTTLIGPHRDDFEILFDTHPVGEFGSRGQQRSITLALKLSEIEYIEKKKGERPILLLDDIFSELDEKHKEAVMNVIGNQQTIFTSTQTHDFTPKGTLIELGK
jgi:DNA replication and repair protein RecF